MERNTSSDSSEAYPMNSGEGMYSYSNNSSIQRKAVDMGKEYINEAIAEKLDIKNFSSLKTFRVADLGCSVGPNTFFAMQNIIDAVKLKYQCQGLNSQHTEFQVFFNDHVSNDFNMLFASLPPNKQYYAAGVPGSFYGRLFPEASLHLVYSSYALLWMSKIPQDVVDKSSPAWNKGRIHYLNAKDEVVEAYEAQYKKDMECFFNARAQEIVCGGLMVLIFSGCPDGISHSQAMAGVLFEIMFSCLMDLAKKGLTSEEKIDSFNMPIYYASPQELEAAVERNGCFSIERMEFRSVKLDPIPKAKIMTFHTRAAMEGIFKKQFGEEILDEFFESFCKKLEESTSKLETGEAINLFVILKRKED